MRQRSKESAKFFLWLVLGRRTVGKVQGNSQNDRKEQPNAKLKVEAQWSNINFIQLQHDQGDNYC